VRFLVALFLVGLIVSSIAVLQVPAASAHGCAPSVPPSVPGSPAPAPATQGVILLNEVLLNPQSHWNCSEPGTTFSDRDAWVELYNPQSRPFNLYTAHTYLDSGPATNPYYLPFGASIPAHGFLVIFPRTDAQFTLTETTTLRLLIAGVTIDQITVPKLAGDQSYVRTADGAGTWRVTDTPTIGASNSSSQITPTPTLSRSSTGYGGHQRGSSRNTSSPLVNGTQPAWANLQLPTATPTLAPVPTFVPSTPATPPPPTSDEWAVPRRILLTLGALVLVLMLFWCWRLFRTS